MPPRCGCRLAASLWCTSPPRADPITAALVAVRNVLRLMPGVSVCLSMVVLLEHAGCIPSPLPLRYTLEIRRAQAAAAVGQGALRARLVTLQRLGRRRGLGEFMQVEKRQLDVDDVPALSVQGLAPGRIPRPPSLFHQLIVTRVLPP